MVRFVVLGITSLCLTQMWVAHAVIVLGSADSSVHRTEPTGALAGSGWQWQMGPAAGTVIGPSHILTAAHLGLWTNSIITWDGLGYRVAEAVDAPDSDLRLLRVSGRFGNWAPLNAATNEVGQSVVLFGRGGPRGDAVLGMVQDRNTLCGWNWLPADQVLRWGTNRIAGLQATSTGTPGEYLVASFDADGGNDEATVSVGDSGGGVFLQQEGTWVLAGVISAVQGTFKRTAEGPVFFAALFNRQPFFEEVTTGVWEQDPSSATQPETLWIATRVSAYREWLDTQLSQPAAVPLPRLRFTASLNQPFQEFPSYSVDPATRRINLLRQGADQLFFQLEGESEVRIVALTAEVITLAY
ncbi:MAG: hypothetical protein J0M24_09335 [Verrucomicrobia bacterium]|nr:hypothetical protein [Verrucomicrobiota bacterium]